MQFTFESWFRVISGVLKVANLIDCFCPYLSVSVLDCVPLLHLNGVQLPLRTGTRPQLFLLYNLIIPYSTNILHDEPGFLL